MSTSLPRHLNVSTEVGVAVDEPPEGVSFLSLSRFFIKTNIYRERIGSDGL